MIDPSESHSLHGNEGMPVALNDAPPVPSAGGLVVSDKRGVLEPGPTAKVSVG